LEAPGSGFNNRIQLLLPVLERIIERDVRAEKKTPSAGQLGLTGEAQPIFSKQLRFNPTV
jgi:hypothetical protein